MPSHIDGHNQSNRLQEAFTKLNRAFTLYLFLICNGSDRLNGFLDGLYLEQAEINLHMQLVTGNGAPGGRKGKRQRKRKSQ